MFVRKQLGEILTKCNYYIFSIWPILLASSSLSQAAAHLDLGASSSYFANETFPSQTLNLDLKWKSEDQFHEARLRAFVESGEGAHRSVDLDSVVFRAPIFETGHLWMGRTHPGEEGLANSRFQATGAIGHNWAQYQMQALSPRVSGWVGSGLFHRFGDSGFSLTAAYSPVFLPTFGPSLSFSETQATEGSRFARLPPSSIRLNDSALVPLRYRINTGDLSKIVFQNQAFVSTSYTRPWGRLSAMAWTAPDPSPSVDAAGKLVVTQQDDVRVLVTARPKFPRRNYLGSRLQLFEIPGTPEIETAYEFGRRQWTWSLAVDVLKTKRSQLRVGWLDEIRAETETSSNTSAKIPKSPDYADGLFWAELRHRHSPRVLSRVRLERHFSSDNVGGWFQPGIEYLANSKLTLFAEASILTGEDQSYFGTWRSLDSVGVGARYLW